MKFYCPRCHKRKSLLGGPCGTHGAWIGHFTYGIIRKKITSFSRDMFLNVSVDQPLCKKCMESFQSVLSDWWRIGA